MLIESRYAYFEGAIRPMAEAKVSIQTAVVNYGLGVFEGIRSYWIPEREESLVFRLGDHLERLRRNGRILLMDLPVTVERVAEVVAQLVAQEGVRGDAYIRPLLYKAANEIGPHVHDSPCDLSIFVTPLARYADTSAGIRVVVSSWRRIGDSTIPPRGKITGSYANSALAKSEAVLAGADDAVLLSEDGAVCEGTVSNLFLVRAGHLITPPVTAGILEGITRASVLTLAEDLGIPLAERSVQRSELYIADEAFLCGTAMEVAPIIEVDRRPVGDGAPGPITRCLAQALDAAAHGRSSGHGDWCTPVSLSR